MKPIPVQKPYKYEGETYQWLDYNNKVLLLKPDKNGNDAHYQINGKMCTQAAITGYVVKDFPANYRWFKPDWWYKLTDYFVDETVDNNVVTETRTGLFFLTRKYERMINRRIRPFIISEQIPGEEENYFIEYSGVIDTFINENKFIPIPADKILNRIIKKASIETGLRLKPDFEDLTYGVHWVESYIPVKVGINEKYILTWNNCD